MPLGGIFTFVLCPHPDYLMLNRVQHRPLLRYNSLKNENIFKNKRIKETTNLREHLFIQGDRKDLDTFYFVITFLPLGAFI